MDDPQRIVDDPDASPLARSLVASAAEDGPSASHRAAVAKRLGIAAVLVAGGGEVGAGASAAAGAIWWKVGLIVVALGGSITGGVAVMRAREAGPEGATAPVAVRAPAPSQGVGRMAEPEVEPEIASAPEPASASAQIAAEPVPVVKPAAVARPRSATAPAAAPAAPATPATHEAPEQRPVEAAEAIEPPAPAVPLTPAPSVPVRRLAAEVAILDRARTALRRGDTADATTALDEHAREFTDGALLAEAELVRIETLIRAGEIEAARRRAGDFLVRFPQSPLAKRLRSLVDRLPPSAKESP